MVDFLEYGWHNLVMNGFYLGQDAALSFVLDRLSYGFGDVSPLILISNVFFVVELLLKCELICSLTRSLAHHGVVSERSLSC